MDGDLLLEDIIMACFSKFAKALAFILPFVISLITLYYLTVEPGKISPIQKVAELKDKNDEIFSKWQDNVNKVFENTYFENIQAKKDDKIYELDKLNDNKKLIFKIMVFSKVEDECKKMLSNPLSQKQTDSVTDILEKCKKNVHENKQKLYNLKGDKTHLFDKYFLENLDVYIHN
jgi:L-rhamnose mutarotase